MATPNLKFYGLSALPGALEPDAFYFIENGTYAESYITNSSGEARMVGNSVMINALITSALANWSESSSQVIIVSDIDARNDLVATADHNLMVLVIDATGDSTVSVGSALYALDHVNETWHKLAEYESMDVVLDWDDLVNGPTSSAAQIDDAVTKAHSHSNKAQLDKIGESPEGDLTYGGKGVKTQWETKDW